jgi:hypothetical protein
MIRCVLIAASLMTSLPAWPTEAPITRPVSLGLYYLHTPIIEQQNNGCFKPRRLSSDVYIPTPLIESALSAGKLSIRAVDDQHWVAYHDSFQERDFRYVAPFPSLIGSGISALPSTFDVSVSEAGVVTVLEAGRETALRTAYPWMKSGTLEWTGSETLDLVTGVDTWQFHASLDGVTIQPDRPYSCHFSGTLDARLQGKRSVVVGAPPAPPSLPPPADCTAHFLVNDSPPEQPNPNPHLNYRVDDNVVLLSTDNGGWWWFAKSGIQWGTVLKPTAEATADDVYEVIQDMTEWKGMAIYSDGMRVIPWMVPTGPPAPFTAPPWLDKPNSNTLPTPYFVQLYSSGLGQLLASDSPQLRIPATIGAFKLGGFTFTKRFTTYFGCTNPKVDRQLARTDPHYWLHTMATLDWEVTYVGSAEFTPDGEFLQLHVSQLSGVSILGFNHDNAAPVKVDGPTANCVNNYDMPLAAGTPAWPARGTAADIPALCARSPDWGWYYPPGTPQNPLPGP